VGGVDAVLTPAGEGHPQVARDREHIHRWAQGITLSRMLVSVRLASVPSGARSIPKTTVGAQGEQEIDQYQDKEGNDQ
jgi:hypothetical protein